MMPIIVHSTRAAWLGCRLKDEPTQSTDNTPCQTGTVRGTARKLQFCRVNIS